MITDWSHVNIYVYPGAVDMRKQINGLALLVEEELEADPFSGNLFLFCNRRRSHLCQATSMLTPWRHEF